MHFFYAAQLIIMMVLPLVQMVLKAIGIGFVTYVGSNLIMEQAKDYIISHAGNMGNIIQQIMGLAKIDVAINIYFAAITTRMVLSGLNKMADRKRNQVWRAPGGTSIDA
jgi:exosortase/archaeosortase